MTGLDSEDMMEIYFVFFFPLTKKKKETLSTLHTLPKPHGPTLKPKLCQRVQSCLLTHQGMEVICQS
jgi:hypothetical protein